MFEIHFNPPDLRRRNGANHKDGAKKIAKNLTVHPDIPGAPHFYSFQFLRGKGPHKTQEDSRR